MRTKQETIDYCNEKIRDVRSTPINKRIGEKQLILGAIERTYQDVIDFLEEKDETTETTVVG